MMEGPANPVVLPQATNGTADVDVATKATPSDKRRWQDFALILDRVVFVIFLSCIIVTFITVFPLPTDVFG